MFPMFPILFILILVVVLAAVMGPMTWRQPQSDERLSELPLHQRAFDILDQCLASGEIDKTEYDERRRMIVQGG